jgi:phosphoacetylglucosamine mutase
MMNLLPSRIEPSAVAMETAWQHIGDMLQEHPIKASLSYGTAGFRGHADLMFAICVRLAVWACCMAHSNTGIMITASHNPPDDNGVKVVDYKTGGMVDAETEQILTRIVRCATLDDMRREFPDVFDSEVLHKRQSHTIHVGYDTRTSSPQLAALIIKVAWLSDIVIVNHGVLTTPILHHIVWQNRQAPEAGYTGTIDSYYKHTVQAYIDLMLTCNPQDTLHSQQQKQQQRQQLSQLVLDCACGVGYPAMQILIHMLQESGVPLNIQLINSPQDGPVNVQCGSDYVQTLKELPRGYERGSYNTPYAAASFDGDADRLLYYYVDYNSQFSLLNGDHMSAIVAKFIQEELNEIPTGAVSLGIVQTAYANGASRAYFDKCNIATVTTKTGVKHLHKAAVKLDVGIYFEANGHGTVVFSDAFVKMLSKYEPSSPRQTLAHKRLNAVTRLLNPAVGDALTDLLLISAILQIYGWNLRDWHEQTYADMPSIQTVVRLGTRTRHGITTNEDETRCLTPTELQAALDEAVRASGQSARAFVRPSGTEPVVRVYAEASTMEQAVELARQAGELVLEYCGGSRNE